MKNIILADESLYNKDVVNSKKPVILYFYADECLPCINLNLVLDNIAGKYEDLINIVKIHKQTNNNLAEKLNIKTCPTLLFYKGGNEVCTRLTGYISGKEVNEAVKRLLEDYCDQQEKEIVNADVLILGGGPAGLSAAIYSARAKLSTIVVDEGMVGGQVASTFSIYNYPGTNGVIRGMDLMDNMKKQAIFSEARIDDLKEVLEISVEGETKSIKTTETLYKAKTLIIATGAVPRKLPADGEAEFRGRGVHYCATCDGPMYQDADLIVVGGGNSALEEAVFLTRYAKSITVVHRSDHFSASKGVQNELFKQSGIKTLMNSEIISITGNKFVTGVKIKDNKTNRISELPIEGIFVYIGMIPNSQIFTEKINTNEGGYIITNEDMETNVSGVYAIGDIRDKKVRQISTAVGDGTVAAIMAERYIHNKN